MSLGRSTGTQQVGHAWPVFGVARSFEHLILGTAPARIRTILWQFLDISDNSWFASTCCVNFFCSGSGVQKFLPPEWNIILRHH